MIKIYRRGVHEVDLTVSLVGLATSLISISYKPCYSNGREEEPDITGSSSRFFYFESFWQRRLGALASNSSLHELSGFADQPIPLESRSGVHLVSLNMVMSEDALVSVEAIRG